MKNCRFKDKVIDYFEGLMDNQGRTIFGNHLRDCVTCQEELSAIQKIYKIIDKDEIPIPEKEFFERLKDDIRRKEISFRRPLWKILGILAPVLGILVFILFINFRKEQSVEIAIPISYFSQDEYLNKLLLEKIVDSGIVNQFAVLDQYFVVDIDDGIRELTTDERQKLLKLIGEKYGEEYL
ncbi:MAG: hypothetical protein ACPL28_00685 [bacterium]